MALKVQFVCCFLFLQLRSLAALFIQRVRRRQRASYPITYRWVASWLRFRSRTLSQRCLCNVPNTTETPTHHSIILACTYLKVSPCIELLRYASCAILLVVSEGMHEGLGLNYYADSELHCGMWLFSRLKCKDETSERQEEGCFTCAHVNIYIYTYLMQKLNTIVLLYHVDCSAHNLHLVRITCQSSSSRVLLLSWCCSNAYFNLLALPDV